MIVIYNKVLPLGRFRAINILGVVFAKKRWGKMQEVELRHEHIHTLQQRELLFVFFYIIYVLEFAVRLVLNRGKWNAAYWSVSFEQEAYGNQSNPQYENGRKPYSWVKYW